MRRQIPARIINMHKRAIHIRHALEDILQTLAQIVGISQADVLVDDDVDLDVELVARVVRLEALDLLDGFGEAHGQVQQDVALVGGGGGAGEVADVREGGAGPVYDDVE